MRRALVGLACLCLTPATAHATLPGQNGRLLVWSGPPDTATAQMWTLRPDAAGLHLKNITPAGLDFGGGFRPANWSPDGSHIVVFALLPGSGWLLYIEDVATRSVRNIPLPAPLQAGPAHYSPDGRWLVMTGDPGIWLISVDGTVVRQLTFPTGFAADDAVGFTPDGQWIVYSRSGDGSGTALYEIRPDGSALRRLRRSANLSGVDLSPDGTRVAGVLDEGRHNDIVVERLRGARHRYAVSLDPPSYANSFYQPVWSPDGTRIAYVAAVGPASGDDSFTLEIVDAADGGHRQTVSLPFQAFAPAWQPLASG